MTAQLIAVRGIGPWTADLFLLGALGRPDVLPAGDLRLRSVVRAAYGLEATPSERRGADARRALAPPPLARDRLPLLLEEGFHRRGPGNVNAMSPREGPMTDQEIQELIERLVAEEKALQDRGVGEGMTEDEHRRLEEVRLELDRQWDLLRQRRGREEFGLDPDVVRARDPETVEDYEQ